jgi:hypothetical protein
LDCMLPNTRISSFIWLLVFIFFSPKQNDLFDPNNLS